jgi:hypothetical protein
MSTNMTLITSVTVGSGGAASVTLPATGTIPATYTDLKVVASIRTEGTGSPYLYLRFNGSSTGYSNRRIIGDGSAASSSAPGDAYIIGGICNTTDQTTSTFSSHDIYIPNYAGSNNKSVSVDAVTENNATSARAIMLASLWSNSAAITSIVLTNEAAVDFAEGSTFYLYGISNVTSTTKATGGIVSSDGTYNYHMFPYSGTFTPTQNITADYLVIAGGGGGGSNPNAGGGGAGGLRSTVGATGGGGSLESALSLTANTAYTVTVGAGGAGASYPPTATGATGSNSVFSTITSTGGGGGAGYNTSATTGGSGGGGSFETAAYVGAAGTANQGYAGGNGANTGLSPYIAGGGGGAGAVGGQSNGGNGVQITAFANATQTGTNNGYYAGGGGGGRGVSTNDSSGGLGGGGAGGTRALANTGGGGGGASNAIAGNAGGAGGSGLVIIRYAI